jgi:DNA-binding transcriptional LysR family regulator
MIMGRLQLLVSIAKCLNISEASRACRISQPAVSRHLRMLQEDLGITLLKRRGRGIALTPAGEAFFSETAAFASRLDKFKQSYSRYNEVGLTIASSPGASGNLLPCLMTKFRRHHPATILNLRTGSAAQIESWLINSEVEVALVSNPIMSLSIRREPYRVEKRTAFVRPDHPLAGKDLRQIAAASAIDFVVRLRIGERSEAERELRAILSQGNFKIAMRCDSPESVKQAVREGAGIGILFDGVIRREIQQGDFAEVKVPGLEGIRQRYLVYRNEDSLSSVAKEFLAFVRKSATQATRTESKIGQRSKRVGARDRVLEVM